MKKQTTDADERRAKEKTRASALRELDKSRRLRLLENLIIKVMCLTDDQAVMVDRFLDACIKAR